MHWLCYFLIFMQPLWAPICSCQPLIQQLTNNQSIQNIWLNQKICPATVIQVRCEVLCTVYLYIHSMAYKYVWKSNLKNMVSPHSSSLSEFHSAHDHFWCNNWNTINHSKTSEWLYRSTQPQQHRCKQLNTCSRHKNGQMDRWTDRPTDRPTERPTDR